MRFFKTVLVVLALSALPLRAADTPNSALSQIVDRIISTEQTEMGSLKPFTPLVETYIQNLRGDNTGFGAGWRRYFLGRALLAKGVDLETLDRWRRGRRRLKHKMFGGLGNMLSLSMQFLPRGFLQMIYLDTNGFDKQHYKFEYVRREFLGEVRCLVFDVTPAKAGKRALRGPHLGGGSGLPHRALQRRVQRQHAHQLFLPLR